MFTETNRYFYRTLTKTEQKAAEQAILWLAKKHLKPATIALLRVEHLDRESKVLEITREYKGFTIERRIGYQGTALEAYLEQTFPCLKSRDWLFPTSVWTGSNRPSYGSHVKIPGVENFIKNDRKRLLIKLKRYSIIEVSTKRSHIQKQLMVGRQ